MNEKDLKSLAEDSELRKAVRHVHEEDYWRKARELDQKEYIDSLNNDLGENP